MIPLSKQAHDDSFSRLHINTYSASSIVSIAVRRSSFLGPIWIPPKAFIHILSASSGRQLSSVVCCLSLSPVYFQFQVMINNHIYAVLILILCRLYRIGPSRLDPTPLVKCLLGDQDRDHLKMFNIVDLLYNKWYLTSAKL